MPRPTAAQLAYGSATVVCSTLALLLLTRTTNGFAVAAIGVAAMSFGLLVAVALPMSRTVRGARKAAHTVRTNRASAGISAAASADGLTTRVPTPRAHVGAEARVGEHSLRR
ncbi:hypothetical protein HRW14_28065 [Streptomyces lunaelactis]|uniref:hypothetical protein n=1 Tax=Streptomyces lunaelactis TaxID=1535768 RepID=UPI0015853F7D|nr:hypothetical protein [Streptomyces lunaelactis]NUK26568.1 hypothetical protein [Streptomyces lunaelactis]NUK54058.1 hypothetical protein [Streptomyces lunaelactis]NUK67738.1 hypothetical protein [Streptomyces lunaelactis]NUL06278.1 hypothetical protein [Streptomyces lunaelactis]